MSRVGIIGCGVIADTYAQKLNALDGTDLVACADLDRQRAEALASTHSIDQVLDLAELIEHPEIDHVVNLTPPLAHSEVTSAALSAGKGTYSEKPLGVDLAEGSAAVELAAQAGLRLGCAPDTFLGSGAQTARRAIDAGMIGEPVAAVANFLGAGPEVWHAGADIFYARGGGPMLDMGPYYLTSLVHLLGPARRVSATATAGRDQREIGVDPRKGELIPVEVPTHVVSLVEFASGPTATVTTSFDVQATYLRPGLEIWGTEATLSVPDPNWFGGEVRLKSFGDPEWTVVPCLHANDEQGSRGLGLAEMIWAEEQGRPHRCAADLALHVLDVMTSSLASGETGQPRDLATSCVRPDALPTGLPDDQFG